MLQRGKNRHFPKHSDAPNSIFDAEFSAGSCSGSYRLRHER